MKKLLVLLSIAILLMAGNAFGWDFGSSYTYNPTPTSTFATSFAGSVYYNPPDQSFSSAFAGSYAYGGDAYSSSYTSADETSATAITSSWAYSDEPEPDCIVDADCDDGTFCNGTETCDIGIGECQAGTAPCEPGIETCNEDTDVCDCVDGDGDTLCDGSDNCRETPAGAIIDANGCCYDSDDDGVCDDWDNCIDEPNATQDDTDQDDVGDACDVCPNDYNDDSDQDGFCDSDDNCPDLWNELQADADQDGIGDFCDPICPNDPLNDEDEDGICGGNDNCPDVYNPDQIDNDNDGIGDACDSCIDVDEDEVCVGDDNCPDVPNPGQADTDQNGIGDDCEPCIDDDKDGVCDDVDDCLGTDPGDGGVDADGCSVPQLCPCENQWANHGAYVTCVVDMAQALVDGDFILPGIGEDYVSDAGKSDCGKPLSKCFTFEGNVDSITSNGNTNFTTFQDAGILGPVGVPPAEVDPGTLVSYIICVDEDREGGFYDNSVWTPASTENAWAELGDAPVSVNTPNPSHIYYQALYGSQVQILVGDNGDYVEVRTQRYAPVIGWTVGDVFYLKHTLRPNYPSVDNTVMVVPQATIVDINPF